MRWLAVPLALAASLPALTQQLGVGALLVAAPRLQDADFANSVIVLIRYDQQSAVGLFIHRPSDVPVSEVYPELKSPMKFYVGGPITVGVRALFVSRAAPSPATHLFGGVYLVTNRSLLMKLIADRTPSSTFRVYAGSCGWSAGQLQDEVHRGLWRVRPPDAAAVFDATPESLWLRLR